MLFFVGNGLLIEGLVSELQQLIAPFVILCLGDLVLGAEFADLDRAREAFQDDLQFFLAGPFASFHE